MISFSTMPGLSDDGEGDKTTLGMRWCLPFERADASREPDPKTLRLGAGEGSVDIGVSCAGAGVGVGAVGSQLKPGLTTKFNVSPSLMLYSLRSFPSASAFPLRRSRCASTGGAEG